MSTIPKLLTPGVSTTYPPPDNGNISAKVVVCFPESCASEITAVFNPKPGSTRFSNEDFPTPDKPATAVTFPIQIYVLDPADLGYLQTIVFILVIAVLVQFIEIFLKKYVVSLYNALGVYLPLITTNCCVLAVTILVVDDYGADVAALGFGMAYLEALVCAVGSGVGFMLAMCLFSGVRKRVEICDAPGPFKGLPITLIAAAITSLSFMGFGGIVENLFNVTL